MKNALKKDTISEIIGQKKSPLNFELHKDSPK